MQIVHPPLTHPVRRFGQREIDFGRRIAVMAIVNRTPDSFYDQGATFALDRAVEAALTAAADGADWVDIGGAKFAPGPEISADEELERVLPVVRGVAAASDVAISVDTFRASVAAACIDAGAHIVNDTTGLSDPDLAGVVAASGASLVITHSLAAPRQPHPRPRYDDVAGEVRAFLERRVDAAVAAGIPLERLFVDPGHDLNKNTVQSLELTRRMAEITSLGLPTLAAVSNKDFIGESLGVPKSERREGSIVAATVCAVLGARVVRMHDVPAAVASMRMLEAVLGFREPVEAVHNV
ncbi:dihydropteroate synthase [Herbiconiux sp. CPCC 203407]|uniref:Dihydropteroate synthase n=1 Tax=Herbiconiux oxytropis TaxID=2970915 RepID=A0AA42BU15_9MICO|nr:dihydropteroate synthase [Herbiconiux oxytropis]MCS5723493.1 dihydropteroate synthase [Herbiconiux oxytropis]MCS5726412.1 dihydropteroate synthase [Herbiconiux oxytropis]